MFRTTRLGALLCALCATALASGTAHAAPIAWAPNASGTNSQVTWNNGQTDNGLYGTGPTVTGSHFDFDPTSFTANPNPGKAQSKTDRLSVQLEATQPGQSITQIKITESGTWSIRGAGTVKAFGSLFVTKLNSPGFGTVWSDTLDVIYKEELSPLDSIENLSVLASNPTGTTGVTRSGVWEASFVINIPTNQLTSGQLVLNNILQAVATNGTGDFATITKSDFDIDAAVPEPAGAAMLLFGGAAVLLRRRRAEASVN